MRRTLSKSLVGLALLGAVSLGCSKNSLEKKRYEFDFDVVPVDMAAELYALDHNGEQYSSIEQLSQYRYAPLDLNGNGLLDYHMDFVLVRDGDETYFLHERNIYKAQANGTEEDITKESIALREINGGYTLFLKAGFMPSGERIQTVVDYYEKGEYKDQLEETGRLIVRLRQQQLDE